MLVGIDASRAIRPVRTGTEAYSYHLIAALLRRGSDKRYRLYFDRRPGPDFPCSDRAQRRVIPFPRAWTHLRLQYEVARHRPDLLFVPSHVIPVGCPVPAVATIHDVGYLWHRSAYPPLAWVLLHLGTLWNARAARRIVVDSTSTARDLVERFGVRPDRLRVAYLGGPAVREAGPDPAALARHGLFTPYFLFVGTLQPRKNLGRVLAAFARLSARHPEVRLALAGAAGQAAPELRAQVGRLGIGERIRWLGYVAEEDKPDLFAGASAFVFPSLHEGFGLPAVEAMAWGAPVIASSVSSLPEVVGDAGLLVDPYDVAGLAEAMEQVLDDPAHRASLIEAGRARARLFTWDRCAGEVEAALDEAFAPRPVRPPDPEGPGQGRAG